MICIEGEIGAGKSTSINHILYQFCQKNNYDHTKHAFKYGRSVERVTRNATIKRIGELILIDTPGTNDF